MENNSHAPEITTHIHAGHAKPNIFEGEKAEHNHPKIDGHGKGPVNSGKPKDCKY